ncbi:MAG: RimK/LysX family protein [bacterium]|nr:RimK/LysX family protein [bacterium]
MMAWALKIVILLLPFLASSLFAQGKTTLGWVEKVKIFPGGILINAKLDTGSDYSSLNASDLVEFSKGKKKWVRFTLSNRYGHEVTLEREIKRYAVIKRQLKNQKRPVVRLGLCAGTTYIEDEVNIADRSKFEYQMLVGRSFMAGSVIVDPAVTYTSEPNCKEAPKS